MSLISSPVAYPPSSSPPPLLEDRKRNIFSDHLLPSKKRSLSSDGKIVYRQPQNEQPYLSAREQLESETQHLVKLPHAKGPFLDEDEDQDDVVGNAALTLPSPELSTAREEPYLAATSLAPKTTTRATENSINRLTRAKTSSGKSLNIVLKDVQLPVPYEKVIAGRSTTAPGTAAKSFYGVHIHDLLDQAIKEAGQDKSALLPPAAEPRPSIEVPFLNKGTGKSRTMLWTEKYRARKFTDLVGDERTHRDVLRWLKAWDAMVFPGSSRPKSKAKFDDQAQEPKSHRKILLLTGPPGLGKTTLAHVCARQAGYEIVEINASDERNSQVVKGRIKDCVGTENVKGVNKKTAAGNVRKAGRPVCVIVDEVDGVVSGSGSGGEGGFIKALIDLAILDQKNSNVLGSTSANPIRSKKKGERFRLLRPMILICNDVYHPALRPLRASTMAEIIHIRRPPLDKVVARLRAVFDREGVLCDGDGVRRLCEATWGVSSRKETRSHSSGTGEGDMRGILVVGEWAASKLRSSAGKHDRLTKKWVEDNMIQSLSHGGGGARGIGRGGSKEAVERVFLDRAGFAGATGIPPVENLSKTESRGPLGVSELAKRTAMDRLREMVDTSGESDRIVTDCFTLYPSHPFQDDTFLSKPNAVHDWLHFHDRLSSKVHVGQEWELGPYLSQSILGFHYLFASPSKQSHQKDQRRWDDDVEEEPSPFSGPRADWSASEALKQNKSILLGLQSSLPAPLLRSFRSVEDISTDLLPNLINMLTPDVKPTVVGGSGDQRGIVSVRKEGERRMIQRAVGVMGAVGVIFERAKIEVAQGGVSSHIYRMEPPLDSLSTFETASQGGQTAPARYAIRQALDQEFQKYLLCQRANARQARYIAGGEPGADDEPASVDVGDADDGVNSIQAKPLVAKRDFFGRILAETRPESKDVEVAHLAYSEADEKDGRKAWVSFHEGFSNAVRKPITLEELMRGF